MRGEPGIGKTRLLAELAAHADALGYLVLSGSASELEADLPFWVLVDALDEYVAALEPHRLEAVDVEVLTELATILPALSRFARAHTPVFPHDRYRTYRAVREVLERLTAAKPLVLVLDDVHWADSASAELPPAHEARQHSWIRHRVVDIARTADRTTDSRPQDQPRNRRNPLPQPKTVETHIRTLFHKLDVSSRVEVARAVERSDTSK